MPVSKIKFHMSGRDVKKHGQLNINPDQKWTYGELAQIGFGGFFCDGLRDQRWCNAGGLNSTRNVCNTFYRVSFVPQRVCVC
ncbi:Uncharacterised protein [Proteus mirabilis]|uniref:Uncharacterized protein n=1 Tax=Proteus mirabilis TaxID=584 RepID=A0A2X2C2N2_PROMI|nr:Uncharacterised protein [Proteus mirabilis]